MPFSEYDPLYRTLSSIHLLIYPLQILYAQKYCNSVLPRIIAGAQDTRTPSSPLSLISRAQREPLLESSRQNAYLVALAALIKSVPKSTYAHEMPAVSPLPSSPARKVADSADASSCPSSYAASTCQTTRSARA